MNKSFLIVSVICFLLVSVVFLVYYVMEGDDEVVDDENKTSVKTREQYSEQKRQQLIKEIENGRPRVMINGVGIYG